MQESSHKERLVGAIVLVALAVLFVPMVLDNGPPESPSAPQDVPSNIPPRAQAEREVRVIELRPPAAPDQESSDTRTLVDRDINDSVPSTPTPKPAPEADVASPAASAAATPTPTTSTPATQSTTKAWVAQAGSFSQEANALALRDRLRKRGFTAFVDAVTVGNARSYRVRVGPVLTREEAEALKVRVDKALGAKAVVMPHP